MSDTLITIKGLKKRFMVGQNEILVLKGLNMEIQRGEFVMIFGPSGCGKSTLLHCLLGLEEPSEGTVLMEGKDYYAMTEDERALYRRHSVGMIYQQSLWIHSLNVGENVSFPLHLLQIPEDHIKEKVQEVLEIVGMSNWIDYMPTELSSGQQQKINLARALVIDPTLIVADEPTGNLDTVSGQELLDTFMKLRDKGRTIIMVTHDLEYLKYATKIYHMVDGEIVRELSRDQGKSDTVRLSYKKQIGATGGESNVRDKDFLDKLQL